MHKHSSSFGGSSSQGCQMIFREVARKRAKSPKSKNISPKILIFLIFNVSNSFSQRELYCFVSLRKLDGRVRKLKTEIGGFFSLVIEGNSQAVQSYFKICQKTHIATFMFLAQRNFERGHFRDFSIHMAILLRGSEILRHSFSCGMN